MSQYAGGCYITKQDCVKTKPRRHEDVTGWRCYQYSNDNLIVIDMTFKIT